MQADLLGVRAQLRESQVQVVQRGLDRAQRRRSESRGRDRRRRSECHDRATQREVAGGHRDEAVAIRVGQRRHVATTIDEVRTVERCVGQGLRDHVTQSLEVGVVGVACRGVDGRVTGSERLFLHFLQKVGHVRAGGDGRVDDAGCAVKASLYRRKCLHVRAHGLRDVEDRAVVLRPRDLHTGVDAVLRFHQRLVRGVEVLERNGSAVVCIDRGHWNTPFWVLFRGFLPRLSLRKARASARPCRVRKRSTKRPVALPRCRLVLNRPYPWSIPAIPAG